MNLLNRYPILTIFLIWRIGLFIVAAVAQLTIKDFGNRFPYYNELLASTGLPNWIWGFGNFDGVHYLTIAQHGYMAQFTQSFFPLYPLVIRIFTPGNLYLITGLVISNIFLLASLFVLYKLFKIDFDKKTSLKSLIFLLSFPTAFYFGAIYSESLFIFLTVLSIYLARKNNFMFSGFLAGLASATRVVGIFLLPFLIIEIYLKIKSKEIILTGKQLLKLFIGIVFAPLGILLYSYYLKINFNDPLYFLNALPSFGTGRSSDQFILLPQVLFRYFKILTSIQADSLAFFNASLELVFTIVPLILLVVYFKKIRISYWVFTMLCLILPTLTGTLTSMPRYALTALLILPIISQEFRKNILWIVIPSFILQLILLAMFVRGYWVA